MNDKSANRARWCVAITFAAIIAPLLPAAIVPIIATCLVESDSLVRPAVFGFYSYLSFLAAGTIISALFKNSWLHFRICFGLVAILIILVPFVVVPNAIHTWRHLPPEYVVHKGKFAVNTAGMLFQVIVAPFLCLIGTFVFGVLSLQRHQDHKGQQSPDL